MPDVASDASPGSAPAGLADPSGGLWLVSTPIGNVTDLSPRGVDALRGADLVLCEDTRHTERLLRALGLRARLAALHEHNEDAAIPGVLARLHAGERIALVSDAGTPLISDPGYRLVRAAIEEGLSINAIPGPNAAVTALVLSGLPPLPFLVLGFPPPRRAARRAAFAKLREAERAGLRATLIWHEAPHRLAETLSDLEAAFGNRPAAVARELTKRFQEVRRATLAALAAQSAAEPPRGEITIVLGPAEAEPPSAEAIGRLLEEALASKTLKDAVAEVVDATGLPRKLVYAAALTRRAC